MPKTTRAKVVAADPQRVWGYAADPSKLPRWWPNIERVERKSSDDYTRWAISPRGRAVAMTFALADLAEGRMVTWEQQIEGTVFARSLRSASETLKVEPAGDSTKVELTIRRRMRGTARLGALFIAKAQRREIDQALSQLSEALNG